MLNNLGLKYNTDKSYCHNFCSFYEQNLQKDINELWEIGVLDGASLNMWSEYYPSAKIIGFDIEDKSNLVLNKNIEIKKLDQGNIEQLYEVSKNKNVDIIIDDGSHIIEHQIQTFEILFESLKHNGQYIIEDLHTSTTLYKNYNFNNNKGTLQYLNDIISYNTPKDYPGQIKTIETIDKIKSINILSNNNTPSKRSITAIITKL